MYLKRSFKIVVGKLYDARCDLPEMFYSIEEAYDVIAFLLSRSWKSSDLRNILTFSLIYV